MSAETLASLRTEGDRLRDVISKAHADWMAVFFGRYPHPIPNRAGALDDIEDRIAAAGERLKTIRKVLCARPV